MKDKICVSKTLTYLDALVAVVVGAFYVMNVANTTKLGSAPKAAVLTSEGTSCPSNMGGACARILQKDGKYYKTGLVCTKEGTNPNFTYKWRIGIAGTCDQEVCLYGNNLNVLSDAVDKYEVGADGCIMTSADGKNVGFKCVKGYQYAQADTKTCPKPTASPKACQYGDDNLDLATYPASQRYRRDANGCVIDHQKSDALTGFKCVASSVLGGGRISKQVTDSSDACYVAPPSTARTECKIGPEKVYANGTKNVYYTFGTGDLATCIYYNGIPQGISCSGPKYKVVDNDACNAPKACMMEGEIVPAQTTPALSGYAISGGVCLQYNGRNTGVYCNVGTDYKYKTAAKSSACAAPVASCDPTKKQNCGSYEYDQCINDNATGGKYTCTCVGSKYTWPGLVYSSGVCPTP